MEDTEQVLGLGMGRNGQMERQFSIWSVQLRKGLFRNFSGWTKLIQKFSWMDLVLESERLALLFKIPWSFVLAI